MASGKAFCPGHVTAFFETCDHEEPLRRGSRGAGFCVSKGVRTEVTVRESGKAKLAIWIDGKKAPAETTELVARRLMGARKVDVRVASRAELPVSQGFGMSGAGALSTALALDSAMGLGLAREELVQVAHVAEVEAMTGLGDVYPQSMSGMEVRIRPGAPPLGEVRSTRSSRQILLCVLGAELRTRDVLGQPKMRRKISREGRLCVDEYLKAPSWDALCRLSRRFAERTGLMSPGISSAIEAVEGAGGTAGMAMLGNSIFASGKVDRLARVLGELGVVYRCIVDNRGARLIPRA